MLVVVALIGTSSLLGGLASTTVLAADSHSSTAVPTGGPDHGVNESRFYLLWSEDTEQANLSNDDFAANASSSAEFTQRLSQSTDYLFDDPIEDVEQWNSGDFGEYAAGDAATSVHPESAALEDGRYIKDAHASIFAVQPSTVLQSGTESTTYIAPKGEVLATADYRVAVPDDRESGPVREEWSLEEAELEEVELQANGQQLDSNTSHRSTLEYSGLSGDPTLTVAVDIAAQLRHERRTCDEYNRSTDSCDGSWETELTHPSEQLTVTDSRNTTVNRLDTATGTQTAFETDGEQTGAVVHPGTIWSAIEIDDDTRVRGSWRFYSAGDAGWHTMVSRTETETTRANSTVRPAQLYAVPMQAEPDVSSDAMETVEPPLEIEDAWGSERGGPSLAEAIDVTPVNQYVNSSSVALQSESIAADSFDTVTVHGIVRGQSQTVSLADDGIVRETNLNLTVLDADSSGTVVEATVTENATGEPVATGRVEVGNQSAPLNASSMARLHLEERPSIVVDGTYVAEDWWRTETMYATAEDRAKIPPKYPKFAQLVQLALVTLLWFLPVALAVYGFDYLTDGTFLGLTDTDDR
ncbi:hypothetical protein [Natrinema versiforme]|uniref:hypothetical protein n=1 Tax=Natrinema versiforme TaxID=88724 RepID=UPI001EF9D86D|nr:hypothetical protein [Natrinema versiforme]